MQITPYSRMVYYHETDRMDVVNHANYIRMAEEARVDFLEKLGMPYATIEKAGIMLPVLEVNCHYHASLHFGEHFSVYTYITQYNGFRLSLRYEIRCNETNALCANALSSHCFIATNGTPVRIAKKYPAIDQFFQDAYTVTYPEIPKQ